MASRRLKRPRDPIQLGKLIVDIATGQVENRAEHATNPDISEIRQKAGAIGGRARSKSLSPEQRSKIAKTGANARWKKDPACWNG
jgi:hypothetical protein